MEATALATTASLEQMPMMLANAGLSSDDASLQAALAASQQQQQSGQLPGTMRAELIGHLQPCMTEIYLYIDARMADYIRTHPYDARRTAHPGWARPVRPTICVWGKAQMGAAL